MNNFNVTQSDNRNIIWKEQDDIQNRAKVFKWFYTPVYVIILKTQRYQTS